MGAGYSEIEKREAHRYQVEMNKAFEDDSYFNEFKRVRDFLVQELNAKKRVSFRNVERYIVDYIKYIIKYTKKPSYFKFHALLMLKELMKTENEALVNYASKKILNRLYILASSPLGPRCLLVYDDKSDLKGSAYFHHLLLECLSKWGEMFTVKNQEYTSKKRALEKMGKIPIIEKYWDIPGPTITSTAPGENLS